MKKRNMTIYLILLLFSSIVSIRLIDLIVLQKESYIQRYNLTTKKLVSFPNSPRGRILDINGKVLVDNIGINTLIYNKKIDNSKKDEIDIAKKLAQTLDINPNKSTISMQKTYYLKTHNNGNDLITDEEWNLYEERKLLKEDIQALKLSRIDESILKKMTDKDRKASYIYYLMNNGYSYQDKIIKKGLTNEELALLSEKDLPGLRCEVSWERTYPYKGVLRSLFGSIGKITPELLSHYKDKVSLDSIVGTSFLELEYDEYLRGKDAIYKLNQMGYLELVEKEKPGYDLYLTIDIEKQLKIEEILKEEMTSAKKAKNTDYYNHSFVIIGNPNTGDIVAAVGLLINKNNFTDITANMISSSYTVGSIVKGASISVGYANNLIEPNKKILDSCIKLYGINEKCSWSRLGYINDIEALAYSSNYYQFLIATKLANQNFKSNGTLDATKMHFDIYREMFKSYGLGAITGIDLPNEKTGITGTKITDDLLLNLSIGQYDTYTPIEVFQYINTIANNGTRLAPNLMKKIVDVNGNIVLENKSKILNYVELSEEHINRIQLGFKSVTEYGTGRNYTNKTFTSAGKTGTSETFVDTNKDGIIDTKTLSTAFIMYAPFENPKYSITIISPNIAKVTSDYTYKYALNLKLNQKITKYLFEND